jgi:hypothetical protein
MLVNIRHADLGRAATMALMTIKNISFATDSMSGNGRPASSAQGLATRILDQVFICAQIGGPRCWLKLQGPAAGDTNRSCDN